jgi:predicted NBD/HSP70 family sugar kinase
MAALLVDLGGTHLRCGLSLEPHHASVLQRMRIRRFVDGRENTRLWDEIIAAIEEFAVSVESLVPRHAPLVFSFPGPVLEGWRILDAPTVGRPAAAIPNLRDILSKRTGRDVHILNDISAAAWHVSRQVDGNRFMVVTVSSGIGSKIFDREHPRSVLDDVDYAGEIGHISVDDDPQAPFCDCGGRGHLGAISSGRGTENYARRTAGRDAAFAESACVKTFGATPETLTNEHHLVPAARVGDPWALGIVHHCIQPLARTVLQTVAAAGLQRVVLIGGFALSMGEQYRAMFQQAVKRICDYKVMTRYLDNLVVLGDQDACLLGAAAYASRVAHS